MNQKPLTYKLQNMEHIISAIKNAISLAKETDREVSFTHNDIKLTVDKYDDSNYIYVEWYLKINKINLSVRNSCKMTREQQGLLSLFKKEGKAYANNFLKMAQDGIISPPKNHDKETYVAMIERVMEEYTNWVSGNNSKKDKKFEKEMKGQSEIK